MIIELSTNDFNLDASSQGYAIHIEGEELSRAQKASWEEGIFVEDAEWETLKQTATVFLVENSERSIQGAGELAWYRSFDQITKRLPLGSLFYYLNFEPI